ncbi:MAG: DUF4065 domain-containing protein [Bacteroidales bacterium]|nr:DUF4065 domain-containing protein [Bacteroidales bacterium]
MRFSDDQIGCLDSVISHYGSKNDTQLIFLTHSEKPWVEH